MKVKTETKKRYKNIVFATVGEKWKFFTKTERMTKDEVYIIFNQASCITSLTFGLSLLGVKKGDKVAVCSNTATMDKLRKIAKFISKD